MAKPMMCKNCNKKFVGKFCSNCGQTANTHRLGIHYIWHDLQHGLFHFDNGIFYTIKQLLTNPGLTIKEFLNGKRQRHFKPLSLIVVLATIYGLAFSNFIAVSLPVEVITVYDNVDNFYIRMLHWIIMHFSYATLILIVTTTFASYIVFKKQGFNFAEHLVLNTFYRGLSLIIAITLLPVQYLSYKNYGIDGLKFYAILTQFLDIGMICWCYMQFFDTLKRIKSFSFTLLTYFFVLCINMILAALVGTIVP